MLPYTPVHHLLARALGEPFVLTSGNISDEPIAFLDDEARARLSGIADAFLTHDRPIHVRTDDSVTASVRGGATLLRRSRGYVPQPLALPRELLRPVLACGAELKNTFCLAQGRRAFVSHHIGDLENYETLRSFTEGIRHFSRLFDVHPEVVAHDLHPEYLSTKYAMDLGRSGAELVGVQHHHAHIASCLVDNDETGRPSGSPSTAWGSGPTGLCGEARSCAPPCPAANVSVTSKPWPCPAAPPPSRNPGAWRRLIWTALTKGALPTCPWPIATKPDGSPS